MNKNEISCDVIIDLLLVYKEAVCSEDTRKLVEEHLQGCKSCRSLSEAFTVPKPESSGVPDEAEVFKKVGSKLKISRFTKVITALMCICIAVFAAVNGAWYFLKYRPMKQMCEGMSQLGTGDLMESPTDRKLSVYAAQDDEYFYAVRLPNYLDFTMGTATVAPIGAMEIDANGMNCYHDTSRPILTIPHKIFGADYYFVCCNSESSVGSETAYTFEVDTELSKAIVNASGQGTSEMNRILETHKAELADMKDKAMEKWGKYLK